MRCVDPGAGAGDLQAATRDQHHSGHWEHHHSSQVCEWPGVTFAHIHLQIYIGTKWVDSNLKGVSHDR